MEDAFDVASGIGVSPAPLDAQRRGQTQADLGFGGWVQTAQLGRDLGWGRWGRDRRCRDGEVFCCGVEGAIGRVVAVQDRLSHVAVDVRNHGQPYQISSQ